MACNFDFLDSIENDTITIEKTFNNVRALNKGINSKNDLILCVNIRSINKNFDKLKILIESLKNKPSIVVCTETWIQENFEGFKLDNYESYYNESKLNQNDGVMVFCKKDIVQTTETIVSGRIKIVNTQIKINNGNFLDIASVYRSHSIPKSEFLQDLNIFLNKNRNVKNHLVLGDFNIDLIDLDITGQEYLCNFLDKGYVPGFIDITRPPTANCKGSCIDNAFIKTVELNIETYKLINSLTDHYPLFITINKIETSAKKPTKILNYNKLRISASHKNWLEIMSIQDPNVATDQLTDIIQKCINSAETVQKVKVKRRKCWITDAIIKSTETKEFYYYLWQHDHDNNQLEKQYKNYKKILDKVILDAKIKHDKDIVKKNINNPKKLWDFINSKIGKVKNRFKDTLDYIKIDNKKISDKIEIANTMNNYFCEIGQKLSDKIDITEGNVRLPTMNNNSIFINATNKYEVATTINSLKLKNGGVDKINAKTLKIICKYIAEPLAHIINLCITQAIWPDALKKAEIVPIFKSGDKHNPVNYRPISLISNIAKVFEKILYNRIYDFVIKNNIISKQQFGFLKNLGTRDALNYVTNILYQNLDRSKKTLIAFLDLAKAFDTVNHRLLIDKLYCIGIRGQALDLLDSYLSDRYQKVRLNESESYYRKINIGVPQGTILGPLLFLLYINDILKVIQTGKIASYADDTAIISTCDTWDQTVEDMNKNLSVIDNFLAANKLSLNIDKSVYMAVGNYCDSVPKHIEVKIRDKDLNRVEVCKYLGVMFDYNLNWNEHIQYIIKKTKYLLYIFYKISKFMSTETMRMIYYAFFHSIINYGIIAWGGAYNNNLCLLQDLQNRILKFINKKKIFLAQDYPMNINQLFTYESLKYHYKTLRNQYVTSKSITRNKNIILPKNKKRVSNKNSYSRAIITYNNLPNDMKTLDIDKKASQQRLKNLIKSVI